MENDPHPGLGTLPEANSTAALHIINNDGSNDNADNTDNKVIELVNNSRDTWNKARKFEVEAARRLQSELIQDQMATELYEAIIIHLKLIPQPVAIKVLDKLKAINTPIDKVITL